MKNKLWIIPIIIGIILILVAGILQIINYRQDKRAAKESHILVEKITEELKENLNTEENKLVIDGNEYLGIIKIDKLNLELPVALDWSYEKMKISPAVYYGTLETNDLVICAHSYNSLFGYLKNLNKKDQVKIYDAYNQEHIYEVEVIEIIKPTEINAMIETEFDLTLYTCSTDNQARLTVRLNKIN